MRRYFFFLQGEKRRRCLSIDEAFQRSRREKEQVEECTFIIEPFLRWMVFPKDNYYLLIC